MGGDCILCESSTKNHATIPHIIEAFKILLKVLETKTNNSEKARTDELADLNSRFKEESARFHALEEEKKNAEKRSDLYKKRFLDAQNAIQELHDKNVQLSSQKKFGRDSISQETIRNFPFAPAKDDFSPRTKKLILAPDTCFADVEPHNDTTYISSDEDDFKPESKRNSRSPRRSPKIEKIQTPPKSVMDSFFAKPNSPVRSVKKKNKPETPVYDVDLDETMFDGAFPMETSIRTETNESTKHVKEMSEVDIWELCSEMDSIPPSPVLSASKEKRFGSFRSSRLSGGRSVKENDSPSLLDGKVLFSRPPTLAKSSFFKSKETVKGSTDSEAWNKGNTMLDSLPLHRLRQTTPTKQSARGNTSLDELFDKTDGDLETTTMLDNTTMDGLNEDDDELNELFAQDHDGSYVGNDDRLSVADDALKNRSSNHGKILKSELDDSFDVLPSKLKAKKNFKYQEVVRKRDEREKLDAKACAQCEAYYCDLSEDERREMMRKVCRHKHVDAPPSTPEHFWEIGIPNTAECRKRGYINDETKLPAADRRGVQRLRRKKPLESYFNSKGK